MKLKAIKSVILYKDNKMNIVLIRKYKKPVLHKIY